MMNNIYKIVFNLNKSILCSNMLQTISFAQSCTLNYISMTQWDRKFKLYLESLD